MGGCAVELDCARRAHLGPESLAYEGFVPAEEGTQERSIYSALCDAFGRQLVPDVLSGASAGGVNGALLGAAMKAGRRLHPEFVRREWIQLGDFSRLLHATTDEEPHSLMQGKLFHEDLVAAFEAVLGTDADNPETEASALPEGQVDREPLAPKLEVTMTDVVGVEQIFKDEWGGELVAREHRACFSFRQPGDYTADNLAAAARTSASFPVAFEPWKVDEGAAALAGLERVTYGVDGGLLDNAPIKAALDLIPGQRARGPVRRYVCYLNADPPRPAPAAEYIPEPGLDEVVGYVVNLPRLAPFVDQLYAVQRATRRARLAPLIQVPLLTMELECLRATATALFDAYRQRRTALSLEELTDEPAEAARAAAALEGQEPGLPWIPADLEPPAGPEGWSWGARAAQRVLHLMLDLIRPAVEETGAAEAAEGPDARRMLEAREALQEARGAINRCLDELEALHVAMSANEAIRGALRQLAAGEDEVPSVTAALADLAAPYNGRIYEQVAKASEVLQGLAAAGLHSFPTELVSSLFQGGEGEEDEAWNPLQRFLARTLAIEVVRRALSAEGDIENAEPLHFVQLTPSAPTPILNRKPTGVELAPAKPRDKLTGVGLGHFAGFYRRSWRANDYMWGRLDAAARIVEMLLGEARAANTVADAAKSLGDAALPPNADEAARWLAHEALMAQYGGYELGGEHVPDVEALRPQLEKAIVAELTEDDGTALTQTVCIRAAQLEILQDELPVLVRESAQDSEQGSSSPPLELPLEEGMRATIEALSERTADGRPLPRQLDDSHEEVSDLGLRTLTHTAFVGLSAARTAGAPLAKLFGLVRAPLQAVSGSVSARPLYRSTVAIAFWAAALYLTMRFATAEAVEAKLSDVWSRPVLVSLVAALAVLGVVLVPALRAWRHVHAGRNWLWAAGLAGAGGLGAALLVRYAGEGLDFTNVFFATGSEQLPDWLLSLVLAVAVGLSAVRLPVFGSKATTWLASLRDGWQLCVPLLALSAAVAGTSIWRLWPQLWDSWWETASAALALFAAPALIVAYLLLPLGLGWWRTLRHHVRGAKGE
jgi:patatin-related protein